MVTTDSETGKPPFNDYTLRHAKKVVYRHRRGKVTSYVFIDDRWVVSPCPAPMPKHYEQMLLMVDPADPKKWNVVFTLEKSVFANGQGLPLAFVKVYEETSLFGVLWIWSGDESRTVLKQFQAAELGLVVDICSHCRDVEAEAVKLGNAFMCYWCARSKADVVKDTWPVQNHSIHGTGLS